MTWLPLVMAVLMLGAGFIAGRAVHPDIDDTEGDTA